MANDWKVNPERAAANLKRSVVDRLAAEFKIAGRAAKKLGEQLSNHFYMGIDVGEGKSVTAHVNMNPNADPEVHQAVNDMVKHIIYSISCRQIIFAHKCQ
jgi:glutathione synthase/RimK-type ligase-like ATP-grasp enzyme